MGRHEDARTGARGGGAAVEGLPLPAVTQVARVWNHVEGEGGRDADCRVRARVIDEQDAVGMTGRDVANDLHEGLRGPVGWQYDDAARARAAPRQLTKRNGIRAD